MQQRIHVDIQTLDIHAFFISSFSIYLWFIDVFFHFYALSDQNLSFTAFLCNFHVIRVSSGPQKDRRLAEQIVKRFGA